MAFFRGDENGLGGHDELAKEIAYAGKEWAAKHWRWQDMQVYTYRLLLEVSRGRCSDCGRFTDIPVGTVRTDHGT